MDVSGTTHGSTSLGSSEGTVAIDGRLSSDGDGATTQEGTGITVEDMVTMAITTIMVAIDPTGIIIGQPTAPGEGARGLAPPSAGLAPRAPEVALDTLTNHHLVDQEGHHRQDPIPRLVAAARDLPNIEGGRARRKQLLLRLHLKPLKTRRRCRVKPRMMMVLRLCLGAWLPSAVTRGKA